MFSDKTAFFSCADKTGIPELAKALSDRDWVIYSAGGTCKAIRDAGVRVYDIARIPGSVGAMLDHRLLTLQACVHGPLLTDGSENHCDELREKDFPRSFELVIIDLYPFEDAINKLKTGERTVEEVWEMIDVGGPAMLKSAIKGLKFPIVSKERRDWLIGWIDAGCQGFGSYHQAAIRDAIQLVADRESEHFAFIFKHLKDLQD